VSRRRNEQGANGEAGYLGLVRQQLRVGQQQLVWQLLRVGVV
jgi:hypothetical protein